MMVISCSASGGGGRRPAGWFGTLAIRKRVKPLLLLLACVRRLISAVMVQVARDGRRHVRVLHEVDDAAAERAVLLVLLLRFGGARGADTGNTQSGIVAAAAAPQLRIAVADARRAVTRLQDEHVLRLRARVAALVGCEQVAVAARAAAVLWL
jgi:hypothetical protein